MKKIFQSINKHLKIAVVSNIKAKNTNLISRVGVSMSFLFAYLLSRTYLIQCRGRKEREKKLNMLKEEGKYVLN